MSSKRNLEEDTVEGLSKKIKVEQKLNSDNITKNHPDIDITEHEIKKFVLIFHLLLMTSLNDDELTELKALDTEDGVQDTILLIVMKVLSLLKGNIETLKFPKLIKIGLKKLESILFLTSNGSTYKDDIEDSIRSQKKTASATTTIAEISSKAWTVESAKKIASGTQGKSKKNIEGRICNKTFKIKKLIVQPKKVDVKKNGQVVRKMTVGRRAIFPSEHRDSQY